MTSSGVQSPLNPDMATPQHPDVVSGLVLQHQISEVRPAEKDVEYFQHSGHAQFDSHAKMLTMGEVDVQKSSSDSQHQSNKDEHHGGMAFERKPEPTVAPIIIE